MVKLTSIKTESSVEGHGTESNEHIGQCQGHVEVIGEYSEFPMPHHWHDNQHVTNHSRHDDADKYQTFQCQ